LSTGIRHLDKRVMVVWLFPTLAAVAIIWIVVSFAYILLPPDSGMFGVEKVVFPFLLLGAFLLAFVLPTSLWVQLTYQRFTYELGEKDIIVREGVITRKTTVIPYSRIQDISSERTFMERMLGLATLEIETAGSSRIASETPLPGIANKDEVIQEIMSMVEKNKGADGKLGADGQPAMGSVMGEVLKELKTISSKLDAIGGSPGKNGERKEPRREKPEIFEPLGHDESFKRFKKK